MEWIIFSMPAWTAVTCYGSGVRAFMAACWFRANYLVLWQCRFREVWKRKRDEHHKTQWQQKWLVKGEDLSEGYHGDELIVFGCTGPNGHSLHPFIMWKLLVSFPDVGKNHKSAGWDGRRRKMEEEMKEWKERDEGWKIRWRKTEYIYSTGLIGDWEVQLF